VLNPARLDAAHYIIVQQQGIRTLNAVLPKLGALTIAVTVAAAVLARENKTRMALLIATALCFVVSGLITKLANQPINAVVMGWDSGAPPQQWTELRDVWWRWNGLRLGSSVTALVLLMAATLARGPAERTDAMASAVCKPLLAVVLQVISLLI